MRGSLQIINPRRRIDDEKPGMINDIIKQVVGMLRGKGLMKIERVVHGRNTGNVLGRKLLVQ